MDLRGVVTVKRLQIPQLRVTKVMQSFLSDRVVHTQAKLAASSFCRASLCSRGIVREKMKQCPFMDRYPLACKRSMFLKMGKFSYSSEKEWSFKCPIFVTHAVLVGLSFGIHLHFWIQQKMKRKQRPTSTSASYKYDDKTGHGGRGRE